MLVLQVATLGEQHAGNLCCDFHYCPGKTSMNEQQGWGASHQFSKTLSLKCSAAGVSIVYVAYHSGTKGAVNPLLFFSNLSGQVEESLRQV